MFLFSCLLVSWALSLFSGTAALRSSTPLNRTATFALHGAEEQGRLPVSAREDFQKLFQLRDADGATTQTLRGTGLRLAVGIAVAPHHLEERSIHRDTWFSSPLVCRREFGTPNGCTILPKFILEEGSLPPKSDPIHARLQKEEEEHGDLVFVPGVVAEKTRQWLAEAARRYPSAKYIGKVDSDTYVSPKHLLENLLQEERSHPVIDYFGVFLDGATGGFVSEGDNCDTSKECCSPPGDCTFDDGFSEACWVYAQGGFYLVSQTVAKHVSKLLSDKQPSAMKYACEDSILGKWIQSSPSRTAVWGAGSSLCRADCLEGEGEVLGWYHMYYSQKEPWDGIRGKGL